MTVSDKDDLLNQDWSAAWDRLAEAPPLVPRPKTAQITLRLPVHLLARIKRVAATRGLPYHPLVRSWLIDGLREDRPLEAAVSDEPQQEQINLKLSPDVLDDLKAHGHALRRPYHRLARDWIEAAVRQEEERLGLEPMSSERLPTKDLMVLLLHARDSRGQDAVRGITRLQKLLFVVEQTLGERTGAFYAFNYGPFNEGVNDAANALRLAGFLEGTEPAAGGPPSFAEMMATAADRAGPREQTATEEYRLNELGHETAERLLRSNRAYEELFAAIWELRAEWDTPDLVERVYEAWPKYTERSLIRDEVAERRARRRSR